MTVTALPSPGLLNGGQHVWERTRDGSNDADAGAVLGLYRWLGVGGRSDRVYRAGDTEAGQKVKRCSRGRQSVASIPEAYLGSVAFFLNFAWEMWQIPFFLGMSTMPHWDGVLRCTRATAGDVLIILIAFYAAALVGGGRGWFLAPSRLAVGVFLGVGLLITAVAEYIFTGSLAHWEYSSLMPVLPVIGTGVVPLLQWVVTPLISLATLRRLALGDGRSAV